MAASATLAAAGITGAGLGAKALSKTGAGSEQGAGTKTTQGVGSGQGGTPTTDSIVQTTQYTAPQPDATKVALALNSGSDINAKGT